jgi:membrane protein
MEAKDEREPTTATSDEEPHKPTELSLRAWWATLKRTVREFQDDNLTDWAAALTYYGTLSIFPALLALVSILGLVGSQGTIDGLLEIIGEIGPESAVETFEGPVETVVENSAGASVALFVGLGLALWTASGYIGAFMRASNAIYEIEEGRPFWTRRPMQLAVTLVMVLLLALVLVAIVLTGPLADAVGSVIGLGDLAVTAWEIAKWPVLLLVVVTMIAFLYWAAPNVRQQGFRWITPGSVLAIVIWILASAGFAFYVANFGSYNKTYGAFGAAIIFLVWMWISNLAVLLGAELNAELERRRQIEAGDESARRRIHVEPRSEP